jgi:hypothetical protein
MPEPEVPPEVWAVWSSDPVGAGYLPRRPVLGCVAEVFTRDRAERVAREVVEGWGGVGREAEAWPVLVGVSPDRLEEVERQRDALLSLIVQPWTRDDGAELFKINLAWQDTAETREEAVALVFKAAGLGESHA